jgi:hypothetical protein
MILISPTNKQSWMVFYCGSFLVEKKRSSDVWWKLKRRIEKSFEVQVHIGKIN